MSKLGVTRAFCLQPYSSLIVFSAVIVTVGRRFLDAFTKVEGINLLLETRVADATRDLAIRETARRELEVLNAVEEERQRMMREIYDGVGSSPVTALAIAERQQQLQTTFTTPRRTLADVKIATDSLELVDGDLPILLANLRHRMELNLNRAGIKFVWKLEACPPLPCLDRVNALQVLRTLQEGLSNTLTHAQVTAITLSCAPHRRGGREGMILGVAVDGVGFDSAQTDDSGKGLATMRSRVRRCACPTCVRRQLWYRRRGRQS